MDHVWKDVYVMFRDALAGKTAVSIVMSGDALAVAQARVWWSDLKHRVYRDLERLFQRRRQPFLVSPERKYRFNQGKA